MNGVNKAILIGRVGQDPETRYDSSGKAVTNLSLATSEVWKDQNGEKQERTEWHKVVMFGRLAEITAQYVKKGGAVYIEGKLHTNKWTDKEGKDRYTTQVIANEMQILGSKGAFANGNKADLTDQSQRQAVRSEGAGKGLNDRQAGGHDESWEPPF